MAIKLTWKNPNQIPVTQKIYRSTTPMSTTSLPLPLATLSAGETEYTDVTAEDGVRYYYIISVSDGTNTLYSIQREAIAEDRRGVGSNTIVVGDESLGYYGSISPGKFLTSSHILSAAKFQPITLASAVIPAWYKFTRNGKIIYVPDRAFGLVLWTDLYKAGLVYGRDDAGPAAMIGGLTAVNQDVYVEFGGDKYRVRLLRGYYDKASDLDAADTTTLTATFPVGAVAQANAPATYGKLYDLDNVELTSPDNEYNDLLGAVQYCCPKKKRFPTVEQNKPSAFVGTDVRPTSDSAYDTQALNPATSGRVLCQERVSGASAVTANVLSRGARRVYLYAEGNAAGVAPGGEPPTSYTNNIAWDAGNQALGKLWVPVLELIERPLVVAF